MRAEFYNCICDKEIAIQKKAWQLGSAKTVHCILKTCRYVWKQLKRVRPFNILATGSWDKATAHLETSGYSGSTYSPCCIYNTSMYLRSVWETWWLLKAKHIRSLNARYNIWKANYFRRSMGNATQIWVLLPSIAKTLHVLTTVPCNANASDSIIPNDLRIWSNNVSFPHLFRESKLRTQDWTLAITQGGQEPQQALSFSFRTYASEYLLWHLPLENWSNTSFTRLSFSVHNSNPTSLNTKR